MLKFAIYKHLNYAVFDCCNFLQIRTITIRNKIFEVFLNVLNIKTHTII